MEELGLIAGTGPKLSAQQRAILMGILDDSKPDDPSPIAFVDKDRNSGTGPTLLVPGLTSTHLLAFSRFVIGAGEKDPVADDRRTRRFLEQAIADGVRFGVRADLLREPVAAAALALRRVDGIPDASRIRAEIRRFPHDAAKRHAAMQITIAGLMIFPPEQRERTLNDLRAMWAKGQEPEVTNSIDCVVWFGRVCSNPKATPVALASHQLSASA